MSSHPKKIGFYVQDVYKGRTEVITFNRQQINHAAAIAESLVEKWGAIACIPDGEDSSGRQKLRLSSPEELAKRCCDVAHGMWDEFIRRDWVTELPDPTPEEKQHNGG